MSPSKPRKIFWTVTVLVFTLLFGLVLLRTALKHRTYAGTARVQLTVAASPGASSLLAAQSSRAQSEELLNPVIEQLHLNALWGKKIRVDDELKSWESILLLRRQMELTPLPATRELQIRVQDDNSDEAAAIANSIAEALCKPAKSSPAMTVSQRAQPDKKPVSPNIPLSLLVGGLASIAIAFALGQTAATMISPQQKELA